MKGSDVVFLESVWSYLTSCVLPHAVLCLLPTGGHDTIFDKTVAASGVDVNQQCSGGSFSVDGFLEVVRRRWEKEKSLSQDCQEFALFSS